MTDRGHSGRANQSRRGDQNLTTVPAKDYYLSLAIFSASSSALKQDLPKSGLGIRVGRSEASESNPPNCLEHDKN